MLFLELSYVYDDDVLLHSTTIHIKDDCLVLQEDLNRLQLWADMC